MMENKEIRHSTSMRLLTSTSDLEELTSDFQKECMGFTKDSECRSINQLQQLINTGGVITGLYEGKELIGFSIISMMDPTSYWLWDIGLVTSVRKKGYGKQLMEETIKNVKQRDGEKIRFTYNLHKIALSQFYINRFGAQAVEFKDNYYGSLGGETKSSRFITVIDTHNKSEKSSGAVLPSDATIATSVNDIVLNAGDYYIPLVDYNSPSFSEKQDSIEKILAYSMGEGNHFVLGIVKDKNSNYYLQMSPHTSDIPRWDDDISEKFKQRERDMQLQERKEKGKKILTRASILLLIYFLYLGISFERRRTVHTQEKLADAIALYQGKTRTSLFADDVYVRAPLQGGNVTGIKIITGKMTPELSDTLLMQSTNDLLEKSPLFHNVLKVSNEFVLSGQKSPFREQKIHDDMKNFIITHGGLENIFAYELEKHLIDFIDNHYDELVKVYPGLDYQYSINEINHHIRDRFWNQAEGMSVKECEQRDAVVTDACRARGEMEANSIKLTPINIYMQGEGWYSLALGRNNYDIYVFKRKIERRASGKFTITSDKTGGYAYTNSCRIFAQYYRRNRNDIVSQ